MVTDINKSRYTVFVVYACKIIMYKYYYLFIIVIRMVVGYQVEPHQLICH